MDLETLEILLQEVAVIKKEYEDIAKATGENFNIFRILKIETREVTTHSAFLAELLNPKGSHRQGDVFLEKFIEIFEIPQWEKKDISKASIRREASGEYGRVDILIERSQHSAIVIENKIYAPDQDTHLIRYTKQHPSCHLLYLTLNGKDPCQSSIKDDSHDLKKGVDYYTKSYSKDILKWLRECQKVANHPLLGGTLAQYINLIKHFISVAL